MTALKASLLKRVLAKAVDVLAAYGSVAVLGRVIGVPAGLVYLLLADGVWRGQSLGKMVFGLEVRRLSGEPCDLKSSVWRNLPLGLAFLLFHLYLPGVLLLAIVGVPLLAAESWLMAVDARGERLGDRVAGTSVAEILP